RRRRAAGRRRTTRRRRRRAGVARTTRDEGNGSTRGPPRGAFETSGSRRRYHRGPTPARTERRPDPERASARGPPAAGRTDGAEHVAEEVLDAIAERGGIDERAEPELVARAPRDDDGAVAVVRRRRALEGELDLGAAPRVGQAHPGGRGAPGAGDAELARV